MGNRKEKRGKENAKKMLVIWNNLWRVESGKLYNEASQVITGEIIQEEEKNNNLQTLLT